MTDNTYVALSALSGLGNPLPTQMINDMVNNHKYMYTPPQSIYTRPLAGANYTITTTEGDIDTTNMSPTIVTTGAPMVCRLSAGKLGLGAAGTVYIFLYIDGVSQTDASAPNGIAEYVFGASTDRFPVNLNIPIFNLAAGSHVFKWRWKTSVNTATLYAANLIQSWFREG